jgi:hypothetical protein
VAAHVLSVGNIYLTTKTCQAKSLLRNKHREDTRWRPGHGSRKPNLHESKTSLRSWSHTWVTLRLPLAKIITAITLGAGKNSNTDPQISL